MLISTKSLVTLSLLPRVWSPLLLNSSSAKAKCSDAFMLVAHEAVQMHGGIGMTDEHDIGLYLKRARVAEMTFGDAGYHRDRFARIAGF